MPYDPQKYTEDQDNGDGTRSIKLYNKPVKYKDSKGEYQYIDNSIVAANLKSQEQYQYKNAASDIQILMSNDLNQNSAIAMDYLGYSIGFKPLGILCDNDKSSASINFIQAGKEKRDDTVFSKSEKYSTVDFKGTFDEHTDIRIIPYSDGVKEDIILNEMPAITEYSYELSVKNAVPILRQDGNLYFVDLAKGLIVATIPIPCMYDSAPESGMADVAVTLQKTGDNTYQYTLHPDQEYLKNATYPVVIDPTINTQAAGIYDTYVRSSSPSTNYSGTNYLVVGVTSSDIIYRSLARINGNGLTYIQNNTQGYTVSSVKYYAYECYVGSSSPTIEVHPITAGWTYNTVHWSNQPAFASAALTSTVVQATGWYSWNITSVGLDWYYGTTSHYGQTTYGILLKNSNETQNKYKEFFSDQNGSNKDYFQFTFSDTTPPTATITAPANNVVVNGSVAISGTASDEHLSTWLLDYGTGLSPTTWTDLSVGVGPISNGTLCSWNTNGLAAGTYTIRLRATDATGNKTTANTQVVKDGNVPTVSITAPTNNAVVNGTVTVTGTVNDSHLSGWTLYYGSGSNPSSYSVLTSGTSSTMSYNWNISGLADGIYTLKLYAVDTALPTANTSYTLCQIKKDSTPPIASITSPSASSIVGGSVSIVGTASDTNLYNWKLQYGEGASPSSYNDISTGTTAVSGATFSAWNTTGLSDGIYTIKLIVTDKVTPTPHTTIITRQVTVDNTTTVSSISSPANNAYVNAAVSITGTTSDTNMGNWTLEYGIGSSPNEEDYVEISSGTTSVVGGLLGTWNIDSIDDGIYTIRLTTTDSVTPNAHTSSATILVTIDKTGPSAPSLTTSPEAVTQWTNDTTAILNWDDVTDSGSGLNRMQYKIGEDGIWVDIPSSTASSGSIELTAFTLTNSYTIYVRGIDNIGNIGDENSVVYQVDIHNPDSVPELTATVTDGALNSGDSATIVLSFTAPDDNPSSISSGIKEYEIMKKVNSGDYVAVGTTADLTYTLTGQQDNSSFIFKIRAVDNAGNYSDWTESLSVTTADRTPPCVPSAFSIDDTSWTNDTAPTATWSGLVDGENFFDCAEYRIMQGETEIRSWTSIGNASGTADIYCSSLPDGEYTVYLRGKDIAGNTGDTLSVIYLKDTAAPQAFSITAPAVYEYINNIVDIKGTVDDSRLQSWTLEYGVGSNPTTYTFLTSGINAISSEGVFYTWNASGLTVNDTYTLKLTVLDTAGNESSITRVIRKGSDPAQLNAAALQIDTPVILTYDATTSFAYQKANNGGYEGLTGTLYINGVAMGTETQSGQGFSVDMLPYEEGNTNKYFVASTDGLGNTLYSCKTQTDKVFSDTLVSSSNMETQNNVIIENGVLKLASDENGYLSSGYFITNSIPVCSETFELLMDNTVTKPDQTDIVYYYSTDNGTTWTAIGTAKIILNGVISIKIKGILSSQISTATPQIDVITANALYFIDQASLTVLLVDTAHNLSSLANVNHTILLRWGASSTSGATYNVYRSTSEMGDYTLVASAITDTYWYDYNLNYAQTFYYKVKAQATVSGQSRESVASNIVSETVVDENEVDKKIGKKSYWNFIDFSTGSGTGSVNIISGNLYYQSADFSQYSPGLDMDMVRTYNSQATYKTSLGYGWDFSFNICLLKEYDETNPNAPVEVAMLLKDGDGTIYRFAKNADNTYSRPTDAYMYLACTNGVYTVTLKDGTQYTFNSNLRIGSITDTNTNGNTVSFEYDTTRGNLARVYDEVGYEINLAYTQSSNEYEVDRLSQITDANGNVYHYTFDETTRKISQAFIWLDQALNDKYGEVYHYSSIGKLDQVTNPAGYNTSVGYSSGKVTSATNPLNEVLTITYGVTVGSDSDNTTSTFRNATTIYHYNANYLLTKLTDPLGNYTDLEYDGNFNVIQTKYLNRVGSIDDVEIITAALYDADTGNLLKSIDSYGYTTYFMDYNTFGQAGTIIKPFADDNNEGTADTYIKQSFTYYPSGNIETSSKLAKGTYNPITNTFTQIGSSVGTSVLYEYDGFGNVTKVTSTTNTVSNITKYEYDSKGRLTKTISAYGTPDASEVEQGYNAKGYVEWTEDEDNIKTYYTYDAIGRKKTVVLPGKDGSITTDDITETYTYDKNDNITRTDRSYLDGSSTKTETSLYEYDVLGRSTETTSMAGTIDFQRSGTIYGVADSSGEYTISNTQYVSSTDQTNVVSATRYNANGWAIRTDSDDTWTTTQYDKRGSVIRTESNNGSVSVTEHDKLGRTTKTIGDPGAEPAHKNVTTLAVYDLVGNVLVSTDAEGVETVTAYDAASRPLSVTTTDNSTTPATTIETTYQYDLTYNGKVFTRTTDGLGHMKEAYYNAVGQLEREVDRGDTGNAIEMATSYTYDLKGNVLTKTAPDNSSITYEYNDDSSLKKTTYSAAFYVDYMYDANGNQTSMTQIKYGVTTTKEWVYDDQDRVTEIKQDSVTIVKYKYDRNSSVTEMSYPQGGSPDRVIGYTYDYNHDGRLTVIADITNEQVPKLIRAFTYNSNGQLVSLQDYRKFDQTVNDGDYTEQAFTYKTDGALESVTYTDKDYENGVLISSTPRESYVLTINDAGNITMEDIDTNYGTPVSTVKEYEYDAFGRLKTEKVNTATTAEYTYDNNSNRKSMTAGASTIYYDYNEFNSLTRTASDANFSSLITSYTYDGRGNQTTQTTVATDTVTTYVYDPANQLTTTTTQVGQGTPALVASYWYDGAGQRTKKVADNSTTRYYYDGLSLLYTDDGTTQRLEENIMEPGGSVFVTKRFTGNYAGNQYFFRQDIRGSISNVINRDGTVMVGQSYDAYGVTTKTGATDFIMNFAYTGAVIDGETGLYYMNARYYEPETGSFLTRDSVEGQLAYAYCNGNPVNSTDPTGHCPYSNCCLYRVHTGLELCPACGRPDYPPLNSISSCEEKILDIRIYRYKQGASPWGGHMFSNHNDRSQTYGNSGCGVTSVAEIISVYLNERITPEDVGKLCVKMGYRTSQAGMHPSFVPAYFSLYDMSVLHYGNSKKDTNEIIKWMKDGCFVIKHQKSPGHYYVLEYINKDGTLHINEVGGKDNRVNVNVSITSRLGFNNATEYWVILDYQSDRISHLMYYKGKKWLVYN